MGVKYLPERKEVQRVLMGAAPSLRTDSDDESAGPRAPPKPRPTTLWLPHHNDEKWKQVQETLNQPIKDEKALWVRFLLLFFPSSLSLA